MNTDQTFGQSLKKRRLAAEITLTELADGIISISYLSLIESEKRVAGGKLQRKLLERLSQLEGTDQLTPEFDAVAQQVSREIEAGTISTEQAIDDALHIAPVSHSDSVERLRLSALLLERNDERAQAIEILTEASHDSSVDPLVRIRLAIRIAKCAYPIGRLDVAVNTFREIESEVQGTELSLTDTYFELRATASTSFAELGDVKSALALVTLTPEQAEKASPWRLCMFAWTASIMHQELGDSEVASVLVHRALAILESLDRPASLARLRNNVAWIDLTLKEPDLDAIGRTLQLAEDYFRAINSSFELVTTLSTKADYLTLRGEEAAAMHCLNEALMLSQETNAIEIAEIYLAMGNTSAKFGHAHEALEYLQQATKALENVPESRTLARVWSQLGDTYSQLEQYDLAYNCMKIATGMLGLKTPTQDPSVLLK